MLAERADAGQLGGDVLHGAVVGGGDHDLEPGQPRVEPRYEAGALTLAVPAPPRRTGERLDGPVERGQHCCPLDDQRGDQVTQHRGLARPRRAVHGEHPTLCSRSVGEHAVDRELLTQSEREPRRRGPAASRNQVRTHPGKHGPALLAHIRPRPYVDGVEFGQVRLQRWADALADGRGHPGQIGREQAVQERRCGGDLRLRVPGTADQPAADPDHLGPQVFAYPAQVGDLRGQGHQIGEGERTGAGVGGCRLRRRARTIGRRTLRIALGVLRPCGRNLLIGGAARRDPVSGAANQGLSCTLQHGGGDLAEQGPDRADSSAAQDLGEQALPAPAGRRARPTACARPRSVCRVGGLDGGAVRDGGGREIVDRRAERVVELLEAVQPPHGGRPRIEQTARRPAAC
ncbi:hypothetical protein ACFWAO_21630 [Streptomyces sp. NPDC059981]|uniref:hypothetical protein n=1 Tax=Streptomyces sp. NPDC059981 TaxID=3347023 RepID=UPI0036B97C67